MVFFVIKNKFVATFAMPSLRRVLVVGGSFAGFCVASDMKNKFLLKLAMPSLRGVLVVGGIFTGFFVVFVIKNKFLATIAMPSLRRVLVAVGSFAGFFVACVMKKFLATLVDAKEFFEFMTGVLRACVSLSTWTPHVQVPCGRYPYCAGHAGFSVAGGG